MASPVSPRAALRSSSSSGLRVQSAGLSSQREMLSWRRATRSATSRRSSYSFAHDEDQIHPGEASRDAGGNTGGRLGGVRNVQLTKLRRPWPQKLADSWRNAVTTEFPEALVDDYEHLIEHLQTDPGDRHVLAVSIRSTHRTRVRPASSGPAAGIRFRAGPRPRLP